jgi:hypothetical protein
VTIRYMYAGGQAALYCIDGIRRIAPPAHLDASGLPIVTHGMNVA